MLSISIPYKTITITCEPEEELFLPSFKGSSFRGVIGRTLRKALCVLKSFQSCYQCPLNKNCYYAYIFESIPDPSTSNNFQKFTSVPHPFIIEPPEERKKTYFKNETFSLKIVLIGRAINYEAHFLLALKLAGEHGIGKGNKRFNILEHTLSEIQNIKIDFDVNSELFSNTDSVRVISFKLLTPLRLIHQNKLVKKLEFDHIIRALLRRVQLLYFFHISENLPNLPIRELIDLAKSVQTKKYDLKWYDWERYSYRQNRRMLLGGLIGSISFEGHILPFLSLLKAGEILHCGKNTSFGLGKYKIITIGGKNDSNLSNREI